MKIKELGVPRSTSGCPRGSKKRHPESAGEKDRRHNAGRSPGPPRGPWTKKRGAELPRLWKTPVPPATTPHTGQVWVTGWSTRIEVKGAKIAHADPSGRIPGVGHHLPTAHLCSSWITCDTCWFTGEKARLQACKMLQGADSANSLHTDCSLLVRTCVLDTTATCSQPSRSTVAKL